MGAPAVSLARKIAAAMMAFALTLSMVPLAWADDAPAGTLAGSVAGAANDDEAAELMVAEGADEEAPEAEVQSADTKAADGSAGGTTISIAVYRSSFPIEEWDLNDDDFGLTKAEWDWTDRTDELPESASPGAEVEWTVPSGYIEPTRAGFKFAGWSTDKSAPSGGFIDGSSPKLTMPEGAPEAKSYTLYALWTPLEYSVIFELAKNPEDGNGPGSDASYALNWESDSGVSRIVTYLGGGRYQVEGFTMDERTYDEVTRTVGLPEPSRTGCRFLGWAEPDGQSLAIDNAAKDGFALNPVRLTQIGGTPVLTARWTSAFGVTAPLSITFGDYDKTGAPGNPWLGDKGSNAADDTTQSEADDTTKSEQEGYQALGQAYFENTGWHEAVKLVGIASTRHANANQVLTTYDSKLASEAQVLGDGTEANPGERLLSLYPSKSALDDKSSGVHFRLSDALDEAALGSSFTMAPQGEKGAQLPIIYGLNLSTDPTDGSANHGLVLPTNDYERKQIATVSYTFATATAASENPFMISPDGDKAALYIDVPSDFLADHGLANKVRPGVYGLSSIKAAANDLAAHADDPTRSIYYELYQALLASQKLDRAQPAEADAPFFKLKVKDAYLDLQLIGICQDVKTAGGKAGLTFMMAASYAHDSLTANAAGAYAFPTYTNSANDNTKGWTSTELRTNLRGTFFGYLDPSLQTAITRISKRQQAYNGVTSLQLTTDETIWIPSAYEVYGGAFSSFNEAEGLSADEYVPFQYQAFEGNGGTTVNSYAMRTYNGNFCSWRLRSVYRSNATDFCSSQAGGNLLNFGATVQVSVLPAFCL